MRPPDNILVHDTCKYQRLHTCMFSYIIGTQINPNLSPLFHLPSLPFACLPSACLPSSLTKFSHMQRTQKDSTDLIPPWYFTHPNEKMGNAEGCLQIIQMKGQHVIRGNISDQDQGSSQGGRRDKRDCREKREWWRQSQWLSILGQVRSLHVVLHIVICNFTSTYSTSPMINDR